MYTISVETHFCASHGITLPDGAKEPGHKHDWAVVTEVSRDELDRSGMVVDFVQLKGMVENIVSRFDNISLNNIDYFRKNNCTAEAVANYVYEKLVCQLPEGVNLESVSVREEQGCWAKFIK